MSKRDIISKATRGAFREWFVGISIAQINRLFDHADLEADEDYEPNSLKSAADVMASGMEVMPTDLVVNCPVVEA